MNLLSVSYLTLWGLVLFQGLLVLALLQKLSDLKWLAEKGKLSLADRLPVNSRAPNVHRVSTAGEVVSSKTFQGLRSILLFMSADCNVCRSIAGRLLTLSPTERDHIVVFCVGGQQACGRMLGGVDRSITVIPDKSGEVANSYRVVFFPTIVIVEDDRIKSYGYPKDIQELRNLISISGDRALSEDAVALLAEHQVT